MSLVRTVIGTVALLALASGLAAAAPATLERSAKVHSGPGVKYQVVAVLRRGTVIDVSGCSGSWCEVAWRGGQGYVAHTLLAAGPVPAAVGVAPSQAFYADDYPGFDYPGYAHEPGIAIAPRPYRRLGRGSGWHHRPGGTGWAGRPDSLVTGVAPNAKNPERSPRASSFAPGSDPASGGGLRGMRPALGTGPAAANSVTGSIGTSSAPVVSVPAVSAPTVAAPATSAPAVSASPPAANAPALR